MTRDPSALVEGLLALPRAECAALLRRMTPADQRELERSWAAWSRIAQRPPPGDWRVWLMMAGRGFGKTRAGAEWVQSLARSRQAPRIALVAATMDEARAIMVEGESGILALGTRKTRPKWEPSLNRLTWRGGAVAHIYSAEKPDGLRGPQHRYAWCDEVGKWSRGEEAWMNLQMGLRDGPSQRVLVTTTPRTGSLLQRLKGDAATVETGGATHDNIYLSPDFIQAVSARYGGTRLGRQELGGELIEDAEGALWTRALIEACRSEAVGGGAGGSEAVSSETVSSEAVSSEAVGDEREAANGLLLRTAHGSLRPDFTRVVIGVDPPASATGDACGIVAVALDRAGIGHVVEDASVETASPERWARAVAECAARHRAEGVLAEANNGGDMVRSTLLAYDPALPVRLVHASRGKAARAEPVALLYHQRRVTHRGAFPTLEDQLCGMTPGGYVGPGRSPDRADALVWALTELMLKRAAVEPRVTVF